MRYHTAIHEVDENRSNPSLHDVAAEHDHNTASQPVRIHDRIDYSPEISGDEDVRERIEKCTKASIITWR